MTAPAVPRYQMVKDYIVERIRSGEWPEDHRVPSENDFVRDLGVSRMTVNRALREMTSEGILRRVQGLGTFVAGFQSQSELLELRNIADEITARGKRHSAELLSLEEIPVNGENARALCLEDGAMAYHTVMVHFEDGQPIQYEDRLVNPEVAAGYLDQDFTTLTPNEFLMRAAPLGEVEHIVEAVNAAPAIREKLNMQPEEGCLLLHRRTWSGGRVASRAWLYHPGSRYRLGAHFTQESNN